MEDFYKMVPLFLPAWFIALLALLAAAECIGLSFYLIRTQDHLVMRAADLGIAGCFSALVGLHYALITISPDLARGIALSRISWSLFFAANVVIMARYILAIKQRPRLVYELD